MRTLFIAPSQVLWQSYLRSLSCCRMTPLRRSARLAQRAPTTTQSYDPIPVNNLRKRRRRLPESISDLDQSPEDGVRSEGSIPPLSQANPPTIAASLDDTPTPTETQSQSTKETTSRRKKQKGPPPPIYPSDMSRPYDAPRDSLRIVTWNVASFRSIMRSGAFMNYLNRERPDMLCVQETKMTEDAMEEIDGFDGYSVHWNHSERKGYSGVAVFVRNDLDRLGISITRVEHGCNEQVANGEGRVTTLFLSNRVVVVNAYVPNSGAKLARLTYRTEGFEPAMKEYLNKLAEKWSVVYTGDLNVAHEVIDIHNSKGNQKSAGHTPQERAAFSELLKSGAGWADSWRRVYPEYSGYTYYSKRFGDRLKNDGKGWRLDYFVIDEDTFQKGAVQDVFVRPDVKGSDHYPLVIDYRLH